jgi:hypothetical protein
MSRRHAVVLSLAIGLIAAIGMFAAVRTVALGTHAKAAGDAQIARRTAALDRYAASLRKALAQSTPALPPLPAGSASAATQSQPQVRIVYHRPPPIVIHKARSGEHEEAEGAESGGFDD